MKVKLAHLCPTLWDPMDYRVHGILQAKTLEWVVIPFSRGSSQPRAWTQVSRIAGGFFTSWATREENKNTNLKRYTGHYTHCSIIYNSQDIKATLVPIWRREWQPTPVFLPGESHGPRSVAGYSLWGRRVRHDRVTNTSTASKCLSAYERIKKMWYRHAEWNTTRSQKRMKSCHLQ